MDAERQSREHGIREWRTLEEGSDPTGKSWREEGTRVLNEDYSAFSN